MAVIDYQQLDERELVELTQRGDDAAFADLVNKHRGPLFGHALRRLNDTSAAEDAVQETFLRAYRAMPSFSGDYKVGPWLHRIMANVCADEGNRRRRESEKVLRITADPATSDLGPGIEDELGLDINDNGLGEAMASLPENYQEALVLRFVDGMDYDEVAEATGVSVQNARARVSRARSAARAVLRGVAAVPIMLFGLLRRGEQAASAATATSEGVSGSAAAATGAAGAAAAATTVAAGAGAAAPVVAASTPILAKAAVGVGMAVAIAVPTAGPEVLNRIRPAAPAVVEQPDALVAQSEQSNVDVAGVAAAATAGDTASTPEGSAQPEDNAGVVEQAQNPVAPSQPDLVVLPEALPSTPEEDAGAGQNIIPVPVQRHGGSLEAARLTASAVGPRLDVSGDINLVVNGVTFPAKVTGRFEGAAFSNPSSVISAAPARFSANLTITTSSGEVVTVRLAGFGEAEMTSLVAPQVILEQSNVSSLDDAETDDDGVEEALVVTSNSAEAEPEQIATGVVNVNGRFTSESGDSVALALAGDFSGRWDANSGTLFLRLQG